jgi:hypothetical protein
MPTKITIANIQESALDAIGGGMTVTQIIATDANYDALPANELSTSGGYVKILGTGFRENTQVHIQQSANVYTLAASISFVSSTELRCQFPAKTAGTYNVYVTRNDGVFAIKVNGVTYA